MGMRTYEVKLLFLLLLCTLQFHCVLNIYKTKIQQKPQQHNRKKCGNETTTTSGGKNVVFFVWYSRCSKALSFWVPSCQRLCVRTLRKPNQQQQQQKNAFVAIEWAQLFKISPFFSQLQLCFLAMVFICVTLRSNFIFLGKMFFFSFIRISGFFFPVSSLCSQQITINFLSDIIFIIFFYHCLY